MVPGAHLRVDGYIELHAHSCFSLLDGAATPEALLDRAAEIGMPALALTDHDGLYAAVRFALAAKERGIRPIIGAELTMLDETHLVLLAENRAGYQNLCWLISRAQLSQSKAHARLAWSDLAGHTDGLIALSACKQGAIAASLLRGDRAEALRRAAELRALFAPQCCYIELQQHLHPEDAALAEDLAQVARASHLPLVASNNVHYARREGRYLQDVLVAIRNTGTLQECRPYLRSNSEYYLKSGAELAPLLAIWPEAFENTRAIAERCQLELDFRADAIPPAAAETEAENARLRALCDAGMAQRYPRNRAAAERQTAHELEVIYKTGLSGYFLLVWDIVRFAQERGIQVRGRGSAANSIVAFLLGITGVDPLAHGLLFERFLSTEARVMPDIDLDFCSRRREEVVQYVYEKYGEEHVGMVCNYVTYRQRSAVRDVGKALGLPLETLDRLAKTLGKWGHGGQADEVAAEMGVPPQTWQQLCALCAAIEGFPRHLSIHVGGMCITRAPLDRIVPLERATMPGRVVIQWDKDNVEDAGLIKMDLLCLRTLSAIDECLHTIEQRHGTRIDLDALPLDDPAVYKALQTADTIGTFQVESRAQQQALVQMLPRRFSDIVIEVALIRPGPLQGNMVHPFFRRRSGQEPVSYMHPLLKPILAETLGVVIFQEQVIRVAMAMGRFTAGEADLLRRAMSRHRSNEEMARFRERFVAGAVSQGVALTVAEGIFEKLAGFASYGFCKSHAAAFAKTAYDTLWLRAYYPAEYYCAVLNNEPMGFYTPRVVVGDAGRHGVRLLPVHANRSQANCTVEDEGIRLGFGYVDGLGETGAERIVAARPAEGYDGLVDFCRRTRLARKLVENVILAGGMGDWQPNKRSLLWELGRIAYQQDELPLELPSDGVTLQPMSDDEELVYEYDVTGVSTGGHLLELYREKLQAANLGTSQDLARAQDGQRVRIAGLVAVRQAPPSAKGFAFFSLEDEWGMMNVIFRPDLFKAQRAALAGAQVLAVEGQVQRAKGQINVMATRGWALR